MGRYRNGVWRVVIVSTLVASAGFISGCVPWHGGDPGDHMSGRYRAERSEKTALDLLDEAYARGEITREEYLRKREDLLRR